MFTREKLNKLDPETIFAMGIDFDDENGIYIWNSGKQIRWVAVTGMSSDDWAIYVFTADKTPEQVKMEGDKLSKREAIKLITGSDDFIERYRI